MPKYQITFYVEQSPLYALTATFLPLFAVGWLAILNVLSGEGEGPELENSIAIVLTMVFILPNLRSVQCITTALSVYLVQPLAWLHLANSRDGTPSVTSSLESVTSYSRRRHISADVRVRSNMMTSSLSTQATGSRRPVHVEAVVLA